MLRVKQEGGGRHGGVGEDMAGGDLLKKEAQHCTDVLSIKKLSV